MRLPVSFSMRYDVRMGSTGYIVDFNSSDGLPPLVVQKLNHNFASLAGFAPAGGSGGGSAPQVTDYDSLSGRPSINGVTLTGNMTSEDIGITAPAIKVVDEVVVVDTVPEDTFPIGVQQYDPATCALEVFLDGELLEPVTDYTVSDDLEVVLATPISQVDRRLHFLVIYAE